MTGKLEDDSRQKYSDARVYDPKTITRPLLQAATDYSSLLLAQKAETLLTYASGKRVADIGCANGRHLLDIAARIESGVGIDFSLPFIREAKASLGDTTNVGFIVGDARAIPIASNTIDCAYSFAAIYYLDDIESLYRELARILVPGGVAVLEVGNARSLNTRIARQVHYADIAQHSRRTVGDHVGTLRRSGFRVVSHRSFQLLPMWGTPPPGFGWTRAPVFERLMLRQVGGHLIDEWLSSLPGFRSLAFRHLLVCKKDGIDAA